MPVDKHFKAVQTSPTRKICGARIRLRSVCEVEPHCSPCIALLPCTCCTQLAQLVTSWGCCTVVPMVDPSPGQPASGGDSESASNNVTPASTVDGAAGKKQVKKELTSSLAHLNAPVVERAGLVVPNFSVFAISMFGCVQPIGLVTLGRLSIGQKIGSNFWLMGADYKFHFVPPTSNRLCCRL